MLEPATFFYDFYDHAKHKKKLTSFADAAIAATTFGRLKIPTRACWFVCHIRCTDAAAAAAATSTAAATNDAATTAAAAAVNGAIDRGQQFRTSWRCCRIEINTDARASTDLNAFGGARTPVWPGRPATPYCVIYAQRRRKIKSQCYFVL